MYQYRNDCLTASIEYNKEFYEDREIKPNESLFFKITIIVFFNKCYNIPSFITVKTMK